MAARSGKGRLPYCNLSSAVAWANLEACYVWGSGLETSNASSHATASCRHIPERMHGCQEHKESMHRLSIKQPAGFFMIRRHLWPELQLRFLRTMAVQAPHSGHEAHVTAANPTAMLHHTIGASEQVDSRGAPLQVLFHDQGKSQIKP